MQVTQLIIAPYLSSKIFYIQSLPCDRGRYALYWFQLILREMKGPVQGLY